MLTPPCRPALVNAEGRKFGIRVWVLVPDVAPFRIFIHKRGLVLFSSHRWAVSCCHTARYGTQVPHVTERC